MAEEVKEDKRLKRSFLCKKLTATNNKGRGEYKLNSKQREKVEKGRREDNKNGNKGRKGRREDKLKGKQRKR